MIDQAATATEQVEVAEEVRRALAGALGVEVGLDDDFFALGGDSLAGMVVLAELQERLGVRLDPTAVLSHPSAALLAEAIVAGEVVEPDLDVATGGEASPFATAPGGAPGDLAPGGVPADLAQLSAERAAPTSLVQRAVLAMSPFKTSRGFLSWVYQLNGNLDPDALVGAVDEVVARHEVLRARFEERGGELWQVAEPAAAGAVRVVDLTHLAKAEGIEAAVAEAGATYRGLSARDEPRLTATLYRIGPKTHVLAMFVAEALVDAESGTLVAAEVSAAYARRAGLDPDPGLPTAVEASFLDHVAARPVPDHVARAAEERWRPLVGRSLAVGTWPTDLTGEVAAHMFELPPAGWGAVVATAQRLRATPYLVVLAAYEVAVARLAGTDELLLTSVVADRSDPLAARMLGSFHSVVRIEARVGPDDRFADVVARAGAVVRDVVANAVVPVPLVEARLQAPAPYRPPAPGVEFYLFDTREGLDLPGVRQRRFRLSSGREALRLNCGPRPDGSRRFYLTSATATEARLEEVGRALRAVLEAGTADPEVPVGLLALP